MKSWHFKYIDLESKSNPNSSFQMQPYVWVEVYMLKMTTLPVFEYGIHLDSESVSWTSPSKFRQIGIRFRQK